MSYTHFTVRDAAGNRHVYQSLVAAGRAFLALPADMRDGVFAADGSNVTNLARCEALMSA